MAVLVQPFACVIAGLVIFLNLHTANATLGKNPSAEVNSWWQNNQSTANESYEFADGTQVRTFLVYKSSGYPMIGFGFLRKSTDEIFYLVMVRFLGDHRSSRELHSVILWYANGNSPVKENAILNFTADGELILRDVDGQKVWSSETAGRSVRRMTLNGNGNLVLYDAQNKSHWESFDHPTNTWLPQQRLHFHTKLTSTISTSNLAEGKFFLTLSPGSIEIFLNLSTAQMYQKIPYKKAFPYQLVFQHSANIATYKTEARGFHYMRLESNGHLNVYKYIGGYAENVDLSRDEHYGNCIYPTYCGNYGVCSDDQCSCPETSLGNSRYFKQLKDLEYGFSCEAITPLSCQDTQLQNFLPLDNVAYFQFVPHLINTDAGSCRGACLRNCSCKAALFRHRGNLSVGNCSLPTELYTLRKSTEATSHYKELTFIKVQMPSDRKKLSPLFFLVPSVSAFLVFIIGASIYFSMRWHKRQKAGNSVDESSVLVGSHLRKFSLEAMKSITRDFQIRLGRGGFGSVYLGFLDDGTKLAVKRLHSNEHRGKKQYLSEVETIGNIHHFNLVKLVGYCAERSNRHLVYEYMCNGSLDRWIFDQNRAKTLTWETRRKFIVQIAKGLEYLHDHCNPNIIHFDIKPQNILLDRDLNVKISDFGLARLIEKDESHLSTMPKGTPGYMAPEMIRGNNITAKIDIYSFGVVIIEIICGRKCCDPKRDDYLIDIVKIKAEEDRLSDLVDKDSEDMQSHKDEAANMLRIAISCFQTNLNRRPSSSVLVKVLEGLMNLEPVTDYNFLNFLHVETAQETNPYDSSAVVATTLSGPR